ncbi:two-component sensor kinase [Fulvivirga imtechensis AK7]|uniref:histidine kinase n=1 Tax=Fulvivirga imtechensis AK7 TaxID=1237149 RepID=L8JME7_9BACT|nr:HAMP domain-containing sensor histidine kinase [Fulvivirga imtechensis]ELR68567.1 two-component sensor kinase [Fulvivirga imtechensis AK7]
MTKVLNQTTKDNYRRQITETIPEYFFVYDVEEKKIVYLSDSFQKFNFANNDDDLGNMRTLIHRDYREIFDNIFDQIEKGNYQQDEELKITNEEIPLKWVNISIHPIKSSGSQKVAGHVIDITNRTTMLEQIKKENLDLEDILHIVVHDLRGPLGSVMNLLEIQQNSFGQEQYIDAEGYNIVAQRISREMNTMINSMIEMVQQKSNRFRLNRSRTNFIQLLKGVTENYALDMKNKDINYREDIPKGELYLMIDPGKFKLVIQNLISNAIKFTEQNGHITLSANVENGLVTLKIADDGIGISADKQEEIFERFTKVKQPGTKGEKPIGLGLSIAKRIVEVHNGTIEVESAPGEGATFIVQISEK